MAERLKAPVLKFQVTPNHFKTFHILTKSLLNYLISSFTKNASFLARLSYKTRDKLETKIHLLNKNILTNIQRFLTLRILVNDPTT